MVDTLVETFRSQGQVSPKFHRLAHSTAAEAEACGRVMDLAHHTGADLYIVHTSCADAMHRVHNNYQRGQRVFCRNMYSISSLR